MLVVCLLVNLTTIAGSGLQAAGHDPGQVGVSGAIHDAVAASNAAAGSTAATQATNRILAAVSTQLTQLQDILIASSQAYDLAQASAQQAGAAAAAAAAQTEGQRSGGQTAPMGVSDTSSL